MVCYIFYRFLFCSLKTRGKFVYFYTVSTHGLKADNKSDIGKTMSTMCCGSAALKEAYRLNLYASNPK